MKLVSNFNERFKEAFGNRSITDFAAEIGVSKQSISAYFTGARKPKKIVAEAIAKKLGVSPAWLLGYDVPMYMAVVPETEPVKGNTAEFVELFTKLSADQQTLIIAQIKGILASQTSEPVQKIWLAASSSDDQAPSIVKASKAKVKAAQDDHTLKNEEDL